MAQFVPTHTRSALDVLATERDRITTERDAFTAFHDCLDDLEVEQVTAGSDDPRHSAWLTMTTPEDIQLQRVRTAYRETVMSVPHYEADYDESLGANLVVEFAPKVARAVLTNDSLSPPLYKRLLAESQQAREQRATTLTSLTRERERLQTAHEIIRDLSADLDGLLITGSLRAWTSEDLADILEKLLAAKHRCNDLAADRQETLRTTHLGGPRREEMSLEDYLYQPLSVTYPVLADLAELADTLRIVSHRIEHARDERDKGMRNVVANAAGS